MSTSARKENRDRRQLQARNDAQSDWERQMEAAYAPRRARAPVPLPEPNASRLQVKRWMRQHAPDGFETATALAEAANAALPLPPGAMDDEGHWVWQEALDALEVTA